MFGSLGIPELLVILGVALIVFGPRKLPEIGRTLGKALGEFRKVTDDLKHTIEREVRVEELKKIGPSMMTPYESVSRTEPAYSAPASPAPDLLPADASVDAPMDAPDQWPDGDQPALIADEATPAAPKAG